MTDAQLNRAIARTTGEDLSTIAGLGFQLATDEAPSEDDVGGRMIDWDDPSSRA